MKRKMLLLLVLSGFCLVANGQRPGDRLLKRTDFSTFRSQEKDESELTVRFQNMDDMYDYALSGRSNQYDKIESGVRQAVERSQSGINVSYDNSTVRTSGKSRRQSAAKAPKAQNEANHQAWRAQQDAAKEAERIRREQERLRKEMEYQKRYNEAVKQGYRQTESHYTQLHNEINYRSTQGFERMLKTRPAGTERIQSGYYPGRTVSPSEVVSGYINRPRHGNTIVITGTETSSLGKDWYSDVLANTAKYEEMLRTESKWHRNWVRKDSIDKRYWKEVEDNLDSGQLAYMEYVMKQGGEPRPRTIGVHNGRYLFESADGKKLFALTENGTGLLEFSYENHTWEEAWEDEKIIHKIQDGTLGQYIKDSWKVDVLVGELDLKELAKNNTEELIRILPQLKTELKMVVYDATLSMSGVYHNMPKTLPLPGGMSIGYFESYGIAVAGGGMKVSVEGSAQTSLLETAADVKVKTSALELGSEQSKGVVVKYGGRYYLARVSVSGVAGVGVEFGKGVKYTPNQSAETTDQSNQIALSASSMPIKWLPIYAGGDLKITYCKDITPIQESRNE